VGIRRSATDTGLHIGPDKEMLVKTWKAAASVSCYRKH